MATKHNDDDDKPLAKIAETEKAPKVVKPTADEMTEALRGMVVAAEALGARDNPEVIKGRQVLDRADPPPEPVPTPHPAPPPT